MYFIGFRPMEDDLLQEVGRIWVDGKRNLFPFEKEVTLFLFRTWIVWPEYGPRRASTARLLAGIITLQDCDSELRPTGGLNTLTALQKRIVEPWYEEFYKHFGSRELVGGIEKLIDVYRTRRQQDALVVRTIRSRAISLDMLDFMLRAAFQEPALARVNVAAQFISLNGFNRPDLYDLRRGRRKKAPAIGYDKVYTNWKHSKPTLGLDFIITTQWKELASLRMSNSNFLPILSRLANDDQKIRTTLAQYHWLLDFFNIKLPAMTKVRHWPFLSDFKDRQPLDIRPLTTAQLQTAQEASAKLGQKGADG